MKNSLPKVFLYLKKSGSAYGGHPWLFSGMIQKVEGSPKDGDAVALYSATEDRFVAYGLYNSKSEIRVRLYSWKESEPINEEFFVERISQAVSLRRDQYKLVHPQSACRLIFSEADFLSGLTVDQYGEYLVVQITSLALWKRKGVIIDTLRKLLDPKGILFRSTSEAKMKEGLAEDNQILWGDEPTAPVVVKDLDLEFEVHISSGQKTGLYIDQRENRHRVREFAAGKRVLDLFSYSGGFSLHCAKGGAKEVIGVDSSPAAIEQAAEHAKRNRLSNVSFVRKEVIPYLQENPTERFDMIILDPPRFSTSRDSIKRSLAMYYRTNLEAMKLLTPNGIFVSCSCSGRIAMTEWLSMLASVGRRTRRFFQVLEVRDAARDHPFNLHCPESRYLKCVIARVV